MEGKSHPAIHFNIPAHIMATKNPIRSKADADLLQFCSAATSTAHFSSSEFQPMMWNADEEYGNGK
jgi:hypothetical protein